MSRAVSAETKDKCEEKGVQAFQSCAGRDRLYGDAGRADGSELLHKLHGLDHHELAHRALIQELDAARDFGKQRVVLAAADVQPWFHASAALPHNDRPAGHDLPAECLESQPLRV